MRIAGYLLLAFGLLSMPYLHYAYLHGAKARAMAFAFPSDTERRTYDINEVEQVTGRTLNEMGRNMPSIIPASAVMVVAGAVLLDIAGRRKRKAQNA